MTEVFWGPENAKLWKWVSKCKFLKTKPLSSASLAKWDVAGDIKSLFIARNFSFLLQKS